MENEGHRMRFISLDSSDLRITALAPEKNHADIFCKISFRASDIAYVREVNAAVSALVLKSAVTIPAALPFEELERMIYEPDFRADLVLDLKPFTGQAVKDVQVPTLSDEFNARSSLVISALLRQANSNSTARFEFSESDISSLEAFDTNRSRSGCSVKIHFNSSVKPPFGENSANLDMPYDDFLKALVETKKSGLTRLDLCALFVAHPRKYGLDPQ